nr:head-tail adaptor protein [Mycobacterium sp. UM_NZ2]
MSETVTRHRGGGRNENGQLVDATPSTLTAIGVAPGGGTERIERGHDGETVVCTVYFRMGTDLTNDDELTVRGQRYRIIVNDWRMSGRGGLEVLCTRGHG